MHGHKRFKILLLATLSLLKAYSQTPISQVPVTNGTVNSVVSDASSLYVGGSFSYIGPQNAGGLALIDPNGTLEDQLPQTSGFVNTIIPDGAGGWFVGGQFSDMGGRLSQQFGSYFIRLHC